jgi:hypothetical protein
MLKKLHFESYPLFISYLLIKPVIIDHNILPISNQAIPKNIDLRFLTFYSTRAEAEYL